MLKKKYIMFVTLAWLKSNEFYKQTDGVEMESPLGWLLADCFIVDLENTILKRTIDICLYTRYLNDIYIIYDKNINDSQNTFINWH